MDVVYVNDNDEIIGAGPKADAVSKGIAVRIARVFLCNSKGELLIQRRADNIDSFPGKWDQTAGGHVDKGEDYETAASRELAEEMGVHDIRLREVAKFYSEETDGNKTKKRFNKIFTGTYDGEVSIDNEEVADYQWIHPNELSQWMQLKASDFPDGFIEAFNIYQRTIRIN